MRTLALVLALGACSQAPDDTVPLPGEGWESIGVHGLEKDRYQLLGVDGQRTAVRDGLRPTVFEQ